MHLMRTTRFALACVAATTFCAGGAAAAEATDFTNSQVTTIRDFDTAMPYPSTIDVAGLGPQVTKVTVTLTGVTHNCFDDLDVLLVGPQGQSMIPLSDSGACDLAPGTRTWTFDDAAPALLPDASLSAPTPPDGTYRPTDRANNAADPQPVDYWPPPAPSGPYGSTFSVFNGTNPNGTWKLYVLDDYSGDPGGSMASWTLSIDAPTPLTVTKAGTGQGTVTSAPAGIDCGATCSADFDSGTQVTLTATPAAGSTFAGFAGGGCSGTASTCVVTVDQARSVIATFAASSAGQVGAAPGTGASASGLTATGMIGPPLDTTPPGVSHYGVTRSPFVVSDANTPTFGFAAGRRHRKGTTFVYTLSEAATVRIVISQRRSGRRKGIRCVAPRRSLRHKARCTRFTRKGMLTRISKVGANRVAFSGRIGSKALSAGSYSATITATDKAKNTSGPKMINFTIVKR